jgi:hypothetical protein
MNCNNKEINNLESLKKNKNIENNQLKSIKVFDKNVGYLTIVTILIGVVMCLIDYNLNK